MAYTSGYEYDIFISYAHDDNVGMPPNEAGWITQFCEYLDIWLVKKRGLKGLNIWFDAKLKGNTAFDQAIKDRVSKSALFFVLHSKNYQDSEYCRQELNWFLEESKKQPNGVMVGDDSRLVNILINNIHHNDWQKELAGTSGFVLHNAKTSEDFGYPTSLEDTAFNQQVEKLVDATASILDAMPKPQQFNQQPNSSQHEEDNNPSNLGISLFLADVADTQKTFRKRLTNELVNKLGDKVTILPSLPPPYEAKEHEEKLTESLQQASLSIHLLDQYQGTLLQDTADKPKEISFSRLQAETAINHDTQSLIWVPNTLNLDDIEDQQQAQWLDQLENGTRSETSGFHFMRSNNQALIEQVKQLVDELLEQTTGDMVDKEALRYLIDTHQKDQQYAFQIASVLSQQGIEIEFNQESHDPVKSMENFERAVREVQNLIIMFGSVAPTWLKGRIQTAVKIVADQFQTDSQMLDTIWVFQLPNCPGMQSIGKLPPLIRINCLDNSGSHTIDKAVINTLLNKSGSQP